MSTLIDGKWSAEEWHPYQASDDDGRFQRKPATFRNWVTPDGQPGPTGKGGFKAQSGRYHLYVALTCPWASRTLMARKIKKLDNAVSLSIVEPFLTEQSWKFGDFPGAIPDNVNGATYLHEIYTKSDPTFTGRVTVPVLWDKQTGQIVSNESADIVRMLNSAFNAFADSTVDLYPGDLRDQIDTLNDETYDSLNNGVYRAGFAQTQEAYEEAFYAVFATLDKMESRLAQNGCNNFLLGNRLTESDIRAFVTLIRFDVAYHGLFKCNLRQIKDYPNLSAYTGQIMFLPGIRDTVNFNHIKQGYYSLKALNPTGVVPVGPETSFIF